MRTVLFALSLLVSAVIVAQPPRGTSGGAGGGRRSGGMTAGHFYGKIVDSKTNRGVDGASVQLVTSRVDTATRQSKETAVKTVVSETNGDFSLENVPVFGNFKLRISAIGFKTLEQPVSFGIRPQAGGNPQDMMNMIDKDLGNLKLEVDAANLGNVTVTATTRRLFEMGVDRKIFNVDKNLMSAGATATEVMKNIPSLSVDIDGNVTMRNATPQLFVDGRPTTLTMEQIPADIIESVELITNPSAKFDASGGNAGILNIVLKKNKKTGYNGGVRIGTDTRGGGQLGGDFNLRQNKINFFGGANLGMRRSKSWSTTDRVNLTNPPSSFYQTGNPFNKGLMGFGRAGFDYFIDNRNTLSVTGNFGRVRFENDDNINLDSFQNALLYSYSKIGINSEGGFRNLGSQLSFKHNFAKNGHTWTADVNYNSNRNNNTSVTDRNIFNPNFSEKYLPVFQKSLGAGDTKNFIAQTDYSNPISDNQKFEAGVRASIRDVNTSIDQFTYDHNTYRYIPNANVSNSYKYSDAVYAAYGTYSLKLKKWSYQLGLRVESSKYDGTDLKNDTSFQIDYPLSIFPSIFATYELTDKDDIQINASRRINRPNFFQLLPFTDISDPQNVSRGNPGLRPEFTNSFEISYNKSYSKGANFLVSTFLKHNTDLITRYITWDVNPDLTKKIITTDSVPISSFINANNSITYGVELTNRINFAKWWDNTTNFNLFNSTINIKDPEGKASDVKNQRTSWFVKMNNTFKLPKAYSIQLSADYFAKTVLPSEGGRSGGGGGGGGRGGGGMMWGGGQTGTAQGYINPRHSVDVAIRKDFTWKGGNSASLTLSANDIFRTQLFSTYSESPFFKQLSERRRDPQIVRLNFSYRFGKFDVNLFKRRNDRNLDTGEGMQQ